MNTDQTQIVGINAVCVFIIWVSFLSVFICVHLWFHCLLTVANVAIDTHASRAVALDAPTHRLIYLATHSMHFAYLAVTRRAFEPRFDVRLVRVEHICLGLVPIHPAPRRLLFALGEGCQFLHLGAFGHYRLVTSHARGDVRNSRVRRLVYVFVAEGAFELRCIIALFSHVLPMIELDWLTRRLGLGRRAQQHDADDRNHDAHCDDPFAQSFH